MDEPAAAATETSLALPAEPWRAVNFSLLLPGLGHWDLGERVRGLGWAAAALALWITGCAFLVLPRLNAPIGIVCLISAIVVIVLGALDAYRIAARRNGALEDERKRHRDP